MGWSLVYTFTRKNSLLAHFRSRHKSVEERILALDRPETGLAKLNQKPMLTLQKQLHGN
jgi:hypothetical protein